MRAGEKPKSPVTMRDVAKAAGVSRMTVSRALRTDSSISKKTLILSLAAMQSLPRSALEAAAMSNSLLMLLMALTIGMFAFNKLQESRAERMRLAATRDAH